MKRLALAAILSTTTCVGATFAEVTANFDGSVGRGNLIDSVNSVVSEKYAMMASGNIRPTPVFLESQNSPFSPTSGRSPIPQQQLIKGILRDYNDQILHSGNISESLEQDGVVIAFKQPGEILITKSGNTIASISDPALLETLRLALLENSGLITKPTKGRCVEWVAKKVWEYVLGKLVERTIQECARYAQDIITAPHPPSDPPTHPGPQAPGYSPGCYTKPNGLVVCE